MACLHGAHGVATGRGDSCIVQKMQGSVAKAVRNFCERFPKCADAAENSLNTQYDIFAIQLITN